jgi:hypothetical protein
MIIARPLPCFRNGSGIFINSRFASYSDFYGHRMSAMGAAVRIEGVQYFADACLSGGDRRSR